MIKVRHPDGNSTIPLSSTFSDLQALVSSSITPSDLDVKTGYPPKSIPLTGVSSTTPLSSPPFWLRKGEQILIAKRSSSSASSSSASSQIRSGASSSSSSSTTTTTSASTTAISPSITSQNKAFSSTMASPRKPSTSSTSSTTSIPPRSALLKRAPPLVATPQPLSAPAKGSIPKDGEVFVEVDGSFLTLKVVPDDNACLFNAVGFAFEQRLGRDLCDKLRRAVVDTIRSDPISYSDVMLGQSRETYMTKMLNPKAWGGAIELSILSKHFKTMIVSIDVSSGMTNKFGEDEGYENMVVVVYSGIHYDALCLLPTPDAPPEFGATIFETSSTSILKAAQTLCEKLKQRHYYTDTSTFTLKCNSCGTSLEGEKAATEHAMKTGHTDFGEF